jgi:hypothetical protein
MLKRILLFVLIGLSTQAWAGLEAGPWEGGKESNGIRAWSRAVAGSPVRAFKATMVVRTSLAGLVNLIQDVDNAKRWVYSTERIVMIKRDEAKGSFVIRALIDIPWPLTDRDVIVAGQVAQDPRTLAVTINSRALNSPEHPPEEGYVRMPQMEGIWLFRPLGNEMVEVTMYGHADPGGHIPSGVVNMMIEMTPRKTLEGMRRMLPDARYQRTPVAEIREPAK